MNLIEFDTTKTLKELKKSGSLEMNYKSSLVHRCCELYNYKPIGQYTIEDMRIMIGQNIGLELVIPLAISELEANIYAEGDFYAGDLLDSITNVTNEYWLGHKEQKEIIIHLIKSSINQLKKALDSFV